MKHSILTLILSVGIAYASNINELSWVDDQIKAIKPPRVGIQSGYIDLLKDPIRLAQEPNATDANPSVHYTASGKVDRMLHLKPLTLEAVMNGRAYISGTWYRIDDKVQHSILTSIEEDHVVLTEKNKKTRLFVNPQNDKIKITKR